MAYRDLMQHKFQAIPRTSNGRCSARVRYGRGGVVICGMLPSDACHRFYMCRKGCNEEFKSCESRDRHEANVHGNGW